MRGCVVMRFVGNRPEPEPSPEPFSFSSCGLLMPPPLPPAFMELRAALRRRMEEETSVGLLLNGKVMS